MKRFCSLVLVMMLTLGVFASPNFSNSNSSSSKDFVIELMDVAPNFKANDDGSLQVSAALMVTQNSSSMEWFGSFWADFKFVPGNSVESYETRDWEINEIRLADEINEKELEQIEDLLKDKLKMDFAEISRKSVTDIFNSSEENSSKFNTKAPLIIYSNVPSALVVIDGKPFYEELDKRYSKISNASAFVVHDSKNEVFYMYGGGPWYKSESVSEGWEYIEKVPNRIKKVMRKHASELYESMKNGDSEGRIIPKIIVTSEPSELISTNGNPEFEIIPEVGLMYVKNTDADLFKDVVAGKYYSLFSGRWFVSDRLEGSWEFLAPENLPKGFSRIPEDHDKSTVLVSVPGTKAANAALRDAQVPNVSKKNMATLIDTEVDYHGNPEFEKIEGTDLMYAVNTSSPILLWNERYYLVEEAVWYSSSSPHGPWRIATKRPEGVEDIPADNPLFNVKYVYIYKQTETEVYTGYTSGYTGSYTDGSTVVYGTGYHYSGWYGSYYYHHPMTYGFGFYYHPFFGWGPYYSPWYRSSFYWHWHWHCYWRPWYGYRPPYYRPPGHRPPHHRPKPEHPIARPDRPSVRPEQPIHRPSTRPAQPSTRPSQPVTRPAQPSTRPAQPSVRPVQPSVRPSQPSMRPSQPAVRPSAPAARPAPAPARMR